MTRSSVGHGNYDDPRLKMSHSGAPSCDIFNLGLSYFHVPLTTVCHLLTVAAAMIGRHKQELTGVDDAVDWHVVLDGHVTDDGEHSDAGVDGREKTDHVDHQCVSIYNILHAVSTLQVHFIA